MFESLQQRFQNIFRNLRAEGRVGEEHVAAAAREIRMALLEADVNFKVVKSFVDRVKEQALGAEVLGSLTADQQVPPFLGWFPFPGIEGADGDPTAALGGGDGFGCSAEAPPECAELLEYIMSEDVRAKFAASGSGIPTVPAATASLEDENLKAVAEGLANASFVQLWLDTAYGTTVGNAMNEGIVNLFGGAGTPEDIVKAMQDAAATL